MRFFNVRQLLFTPGLWIALRFSFARKRFRIINIISAISFAGIVLGVSTLLVVMSVLNGFQQLAWDLFAAVESPVQVLPAESATMQVSDELLDGLESLSGVSSAEPFAEGQAILAVAGGGGELVIVKGMSADAHERLRLQTGRELPLFGDSTVSVGQMLAYQAGISVPQEVKIFSPELISLGLESLSSPWLLPALSFPVARVQSIFSIQRIFNERYVLTSREMARHILLQKEDEFSGIDIWGGGQRAGQQKLITALDTWFEDNSLGHTYRIRPLEEKYRDIFGVMQIEKWVSFSVLMLVILVAALSLTGSLTMTAIDKQKELFYLRCLGLDKPGFLTIFIAEGAMIGTAGTAVGILIAWVICFVQEHTGLIELPSKSAFIIDSYPVAMIWSDFVIVGLTTMAVSFLVSLYPAFKAAAIAERKGLDVKSD